jgi:competence protein ComEA
MPLGEYVQRYKPYIIGALCIPLIVGCALLIESRLDDPDPLTIEAGGDSPDDIRVFVAGAVQRPGVYPLSENARWVDAVEAAGGATADADLSAVNLAQRVEDEDQILVPSSEPLPAVQVAGLSSNPTVININTAGQAELELLPGIGEVRASRIIDSREIDGPFAQVEDLVLRELIPDSVYQQIISLVTTN